MFHYLLFNPYGYTGVFEFRCSQNLVLSSILFSLFVPRVLASHNHYGVLVIFMMLTHSQLVLTASFNMLFDGKFLGATCNFDFSSQEVLKLAVVDTNNHSEVLWKEEGRLPGNMIISYSILVRLVLYRIATQFCSINLSERESTLHMSYLALPLADPICYLIVLFHFGKYIVHFQILKQK